MAEDEVTVTVVAIYPDGDVVLVCAPDDTSQLKLRVSSAVLRIASPVFKTMLGPNFNEGSILAANSSLEIQLPEDDGPTMLIACALLHMRQDLVEDRLDIRSLQDLTQVSDKYGMNSAIGVLVSGWFDRNPIERRSYTKCLGLLPAAITLRLDCIAAKLGRRIIKTACGVIDMPKKCQHSEVLDRAITQLEARRTDIKGFFRDAVDDEIKDLLDNIHADEAENIVERREALMKFMLILQMQTLWPAKSTAELTIETHFDNILDLRVGESALDDELEWSMAINARDLVSAARETMDELDGLAWSSEPDANGGLRGFY